MRGKHAQEKYRDALGHLVGGRSLRDRLSGAVEHALVVLQKDELPAEMWPRHSAAIREVRSLVSDAPESGQGMAGASVTMERIARQILDDCIQLHMH